MLSYCLKSRRNREKNKSRKNKKQRNNAFIKMCSAWYQKTDISKGQRTKLIIKKLRNKDKFL